MKFFLDTANIKEIKEAAELGFLDGVTTNPSLIAREGKSFKGVLKDICKAVKGPVSAEVIASDTEGMLKEARELAKLAENIVVKIPLTKNGMKAVKILAAENIKTNVTLCFSPLQALIAAKAGGTYVSPFVGRLDDKGHYGMDLVKQIKIIYENYNFQTEIIVASVRHPLHILDAALMGADIATIPFNVFDKMIQHPLTDAGIEAFLKDWQKVAGL